RAVVAGLAVGEPRGDGGRGDQAGRDGALHLLAARAGGDVGGGADRALRAGAGGRGLVPGRGVADGGRDDLAGGGAVGRLAGVDRGRRDADEGADGRAQRLQHGRG